jgi:hypothetical protein
MSQPLPFPYVLILPQGWSPKRYPRPEISCCHTLPHSQPRLEQPFKQYLTAPICEALSGSIEESLLVYLCNTEDMAVTIEMQNTGDPRARREILAGVEHVLSSGV